ncbi:MAG: hypothetical protein HFH87_00140 [Lachnospiraceae bacterium]|nr:hypothetical protein [Lachnospiraceae bacterium]
MKMRSVIPMKIAKTGYIVMSAVFCAVGLLCVIRPDSSVLTIGRLLGAAMLLFGCIKLVGYFSRDLFRLAFQYDLEFGILLIILGLIVLVKSESIMNFVFIALGVAILADGLFKIQISLDSRRFGIDTWWMVLLFAVLTVFAGLLLVFRPVESAQVLTVLLGISLLAEGVLNLCVVISTVKIVRHQRPDTVEIEYKEVW